MGRLDVKTITVPRVKRVEKSVDSITASAMSVTCKSMQVKVEASAASLRKCVE